MWVGGVSCCRSVPGFLPDDHLAPEPDDDETKIRLLLFLFLLSLSEDQAVTFSRHETLV